MLVRPRSALRAVKNHDRLLVYAVVSLLVHSVVAVVKQLTFHFQNLPAQPPPFLRIPAEETWLYSTYLQIPVDFLTAIIFAGVVTLAAKLFKGKGSFEGQFGLYAVAFTPPMIITMVATFLLTLIGYGEHPIWLVVFAAGLAWVLSLIYLSVEVEHEIGIGGTAICTLAGFLPSIGFALTYIR
ncbi:MAG: YIP1 family protein [Anaerolineales bacterium]